MRKAQLLFLTPSSNPKSQGFIENLHLLAGNKGLNAGIKVSNHNRLFHQVLRLQKKEIKSSNWV